MARRLKILADKEPGVIYSMLSPHKVRGYLFVEASSKDELSKLIYGVRHVKGLIDEPTTLDKIEHFIIAAPEPIKIKVCDIVELVTKPFKGEKARVKRVNKVKEEVVVELLEAAVPIPMTVTVDNVRIIKSEAIE